MSQVSQVAVEPRLAVEFDKAFEFLQSLIDLEQINQMYPLRNNAVYTNSVVLWMLVSQRLNPDSSLEAAVKEMIDVCPDLLPANKRVIEGTLSTATGSYSRARKRLPLQAARDFARQVSKSLVEATPPTWGERRVFHIDGTTITLAPETALQRAFPPASNQHGEGVWPVALLVVAHELASGAALLPEVGPMYGDHAISETALVGGCLSQMPASSLVIADAGYGIFAVAHEIAQAKHDFLLRMTKARFTAMKRTASPVKSSENWQTWSLSWEPSKQDRKAHPDLPQDSSLEVLLHEVTISEHLTLLLTTSLKEDALSVAALYKYRTDVEIDIRNVKAVLDTENIRAKSVEMFQKELLTSMVSYNLVVQFRRQAAELADVPPRRLSFKRTWTTYRVFLSSSMYTEASAWRLRYEKALTYAMRDKLPNRPDRRFEREVYPRRPKSNQFKKRIRKKQGPETPT